MAKCTYEQILEIAENNISKLIDEIEENSEDGFCNNKTNKEFLEDIMRINFMENLLLQTMLDMDKPTQH
tara:strand:- start:20692 stop:20898 length:207 start_codon:yes stop_codon:yes gene_type:complete